MVEQKPEISQEQIQPEIISIAPKKNPLRVILLVILGFVIVAGTLYVGFRMGKKQILPNVVNQPTVIPIPDETVNWKTFSYEPIGFSFKYPTSWTSVQCDDGVHLFTQPTQRSGTNCETPPFGVVSLVFSEKPIETGYLESTDYILEKEQKISTLFGQATKQVIKRINEGPGPMNFIGISFKGTNGYYFLISTGDLQYEVIVDQILSTFKFTDQKETKFVCPLNGWVSCMPILTEEAKLACSVEAYTWYKANCPNFEGFAK